jgi:signal transduction histidine kinase
MTQFELLLFWLFAGLETLLCILVYSRGLQKRLPFFAAYATAMLVCCAADGFAYAVFGFQSVSSYRVAWFGAAITLVARSLAIAELCWESLKTYQGIWALTWRLLIAITVIFFVHAAVDAQRQLNWLTTLGLTIERDVNITSVVILLTILFIGSYYHLSFGPVQIQLGFGLLLYCLVAFVNDSVFRDIFAQYLSSLTTMKLQADRPVALWNTIYSIASDGSLAIWCFALRTPRDIWFGDLRRDGEYRWILDSGVPRFESDGSFAGYIGSAVDVTDRKLAEEALSRVGGRLLEAQDEERRRIARELHDDVSQKLTMLEIGLQQLASISPEPQPQLRNRIESLLRSASEVAGDVHALSHRLHTSKLELVGLVETIRSFCRELSEQRGVEIDFTHSEVPSFLPSQISLSVYRILQEGLGNAVKHSGVRHFEVRLERIADELQLTVRDSGVGFDPSLVKNDQGLGLISIRERVNLVKGTLSIESKPGGGTQIQVRVPITAQAGADQKSASA